MALALVTLTLVVGGLWLGGFLGGSSGGSTPETPRGSSGSQPFGPRSKRLPGALGFPQVRSLKTGKRLGGRQLLRWVAWSYADLVRCANPRTPGCPYLLEGFGKWGTEALTPLEKQTLQETAWMYIYALERKGIPELYPLVVPTVQLLVRLIAGVGEPAPTAQEHQAREQALAFLQSGPAPLVEPQEQLPWQVKPWWTETLDYRPLGSSRDAGDPFSSSRESPFLER